MTSPVVAPSRQYYARAALACVSFAPALAMAYLAAKTSDLRTAVTVLLVAAVGALLIACLAGTWRRSFLAFFPFLLPCWLFCAYALSFGAPPGHAIAVVLASATWEEVEGALWVRHGAFALIAALLLAVVYLVIAARLAPHPVFPRSPGPMGSARRKIILLTLLGLTVFAASNSDDLLAGIGASPMTGSVIFLTADLPEAKAQLRGSLVHKVPYQAHRSGGEEVHILVIGESVRRDSWSVFGYERHTTPFMETLKNEAIFFTSAVADANLTSWSVPIILTGTRPDQFNNGQIRGNLLDLAKEAGYQTTWLVNQDVSISRYVGIAADREVDSPLVQPNEYGLDESLLAAFRTEIARSGHPRFIGLHILGSHWLYSHRYPKRFRLFNSAAQSHKQSAALLDAYDNSLAYTDWFIQQLIEQAKSLHVPVTLTYVPDHGEDLELLDAEVGHGATYYTRHAFEIPIFVWVNDEFRSAHPAQVAGLKTNSATQVRSHDVFYTVADLMGISWPGFNAQRSFASNEFIPDTTTRYAAGGVLVMRRD